MRLYEWKAMFIFMCAMKYVPINGQIENKSALFM